MSQLISTTDSAREARARRALHREGLALCKSRKRGAFLDCDDYGGYMIVDESTTGVVTGARFDLDLDDLEDFIVRWTAS